MLSVFINILYKGVKPGPINIIMVPSSLRIHYARHGVGHPPSYRLNGHGLKAGHHTDFFVLHADWSKSRVVRVKVFSEAACIVYKVNTSASLHDIAPKRSKTAPNMLLLKFQLLANTCRLRTTLWDVVFEVRHFTGWSSIQPRRATYMYIKGT